MDYKVKFRLLSFMKCGNIKQQHFQYVLNNLNIFIYFFQSRADKCSVCKQVIVGAYYNIGDKILCEEHYKANAEQCPRQAISL